MEKLYLTYFAGEEMFSKDRKTPDLIPFYNTTDFSWIDTSNIKYYYTDGYKPDIQIDLLKNLTSSIELDYFIRRAVDYIRLYVYSKSSNFKPFKVQGYVIYETNKKIKVEVDILFEGSKNRSVDYNFECGKYSIKISTTNDAISGYDYTSSSKYFSVVRAAFDEFYPIVEMKGSTYRKKYARSFTSKDLENKKIKKNLQEGDLIITGENYRNEGVFIHSETGPMALQRYPDDYGTLPEKFKIMNYNPNTYSPYYLRWWHRGMGFGKNKDSSKISIDHNTNVWMDNSLYTKSPFGTILYDEIYGKPLVYVNIYHYQPKITYEYPPLILVFVDALEENFLEDTHKFETGLNLRKRLFPVILADVSETKKEHLLKIMNRIHNYMFATEVISGEIMENLPYAIAVTIYN